MGSLFDNLKKAKHAKAFVTLVHRDLPALTYRDLDMPEVCPLYANFNLGRRVGRVWLKRKDNDIFAMIVLDSGINEYGQQPQVVLAVEAGEAVDEEGVHYVDGGVVTCCSIVAQKDWEALYGGETSESD